MRMQMPCVRLGTMETLKDFSSQFNVSYERGLRAKEHKNADMSPEEWKAFVRQSYEDEEVMAIREGFEKMCKVRR